MGRWSNYHESCAIVDAIYGITPEMVASGKYDHHHIVFKSDVRFNPEIWGDFDVNAPSNIYPLPRKDHERTHMLADLPEKRRIRQERTEKRRCKKKKNR